MQLAAPGAGLAGGVSLSRLCGNNVKLSAGQAPVRIGVCYADVAEVCTDGGPISVDQLNCLGQNGSGATIHSGGGKIDVGGVDGVATLHSAGGHTQLQVWLSLAIAIEFAAIISESGSDGCALTKNERSSRVVFEYAMDEEH